MELETLPIIASRLLFYLRRLLCQATFWYLILALSCVFCFTASEKCSLNGIENFAQYDACGTRTFPATVLGLPSINRQQTTASKVFRSTSGASSTYSSRPWSNKNESLDVIIFEFWNRRTLTCSSTDKSPVLDCGEMILFFTSVDFLNAENKCKDTVIQVIESFRGSNLEFYPCKSNEVTSACYLVKAKGIAFKSPYEIQLFLSKDAPSNAWSRKNISVPQYEVSCQDMLSLYSTKQKDSSFGLKSVNKRTRSMGRGMGSSFEFKEYDTAKADELFVTNQKSESTTRKITILEDHELVYPLVEVGSNHSKWITVKNPSQHPVVMQLLLSSQEIVDNCRHTSTPYKPTKPEKRGFSIAENAVTEAYIHPEGKTSFGPILFHPSDRCRWISSVSIRSNLSGIESVSLMGFGGSSSLILLEDLKPVKIIEFNLSVPILYQIQETSYACSKPFFKELNAINTGDFTLEVTNISVLGTKDGFVAHSFGGFALKPGESRKVSVSYKAANFSAYIVHSDLELSFGTGIVVLPMKANIPIYMLNFCKKSACWTQPKNSFIAFTFAALLVSVIVICIVAQVMTISLDIIGTDKASTFTTQSFKKSRPKIEFSVSDDVDCLLKPDEQVKMQEKAKPCQPSAKDVNRVGSNLDTKKGKTLSIILAKSEVFEKSIPNEVSEPSNLTIKVGKDKKKRRKKRKDAVSRLTEASSSQSGNSTPSSPLSPGIASCQLSTYTDQYNIPRNPFTKNSVPIYSDQPNLPVLLRSATFSSFGSVVGPHVRSGSPLSSTSSIALRARAPGPRTIEGEEKVAARNEYIYDIWGDHFSGLDLMDKNFNVGAKRSSFFANDSCSFFVQGPQILLAKSHAKYAHVLRQAG